MIFSFAFLISEHNIYNTSNILEHSKTKPNIINTTYVKSTVAEHSIEEKHKILFKETRILHPGNRIQNRVILECVEIELNDNTMSKQMDLFFVIGGKYFKGAQYNGIK